jgi:hypothetical protein
MHRTVRAQPARISPITSLSRLLVPLHGPDRFLFTANHGPVSHRHQRRPVVMLVHGPVRASECPGKWLLLALRMGFRVREKKAEM